MNDTVGEINAHITEIISQRLYSNIVKILYRGSPRSKNVKWGHIGFRRFEQCSIELCNNALDDKPFAMAYLRRIECNLLDCENIIETQLSVIADITGETSEQWMENNFSEYESIGTPRRKYTKHSALMLSNLHKLDCLILHTMSLKKTHKKILRQNWQNYIHAPIRATRRVLVETSLPLSVFKGWDDLLGSGLDETLINDDLNKIINATRAIYQTPIWLPKSKILIDTANLLPN